MSKSPSSSGDELEIIVKDFGLAVSGGDFTKEQYDDVMAKLQAHLTNKLSEVRMDTISDLIIECYNHDNPMDIAEELQKERQRLATAIQEAKEQ